MTPEYTTQQERSGASNASDFQPPTQNPQTAPSDLHQQSASLQQTPNADQVLSQGTATISVPSATGTTSVTAQTQQVEAPQSTGAGLAIWLGLAIAAAVTVVALAHWIRARNRRIANTDPGQVIPSTEELAVAAKQVNESKNTTAQKRKKSSSKARPKKKSKQNRKR